jgi:hypothetical protein
LSGLHELKYEEKILGEIWQVKLDGCQKRELPRFGRL